MEAVLDGEMLQRVTKERALQLPATEIAYPFGPEWDVFKVGGKIFMIHTELEGELIAVIKARPGDSAALQEAFDDVTPGYHMNKKHWITLNSGGPLDQEFIEDLVTESYLLVVEKSLPREKWPVDPFTYGQDPKK